MGGGQEAMNVTTTGARHGHFEVRFFHRIFVEEVARVKGGFGPCNTIAVHPQGKGYSIGGEDGCESIHTRPHVVTQNEARRPTEADSWPVPCLGCADVRVHEFDPSWYTAVSFSRRTFPLSLSRVVVWLTLDISRQKPYGALEPEED